MYGKRNRKVVREIIEESVSFEFAQNVWIKIIQYVSLSEISSRM